MAKYFPIMQTTFFNQNTLDNELNLSWDILKEFYVKMFTNIKL